MYKIDNKEYFGRTDLATPPFGSRNKRTLTAREIIREHNVGDSLIVAYNPKDVSISTTQLHPPWNHYGKIGFAVFLLAIGFLLSGFFLLRKPS